jgi:hypothetical protein
MEESTINKKYLVTLMSESPIKTKGRGTTVPVSAPSEWQALLKAMRMWTKDYYADQWPVTRFNITKI